MHPEKSITQYLDGLRDGDESSAQKVWERFLERLIALANRKLKASPRKAMDEEDVVQNAFADFFVQVKQGRFPKLDDRHDLWQVLAMLVDRRATDQIRKQNSLKAGAGKVRTESVFLTAADSLTGQGIVSQPDMMPTPELAAEMAELLRERLGMLHNDEHRQVALLKMQGYDNTEISERLGSSLRTVERWLEKMRSLWSEQVQA